MPDRQIIVITAPSGAGKTTIARRVMDAMPGLQFSVSMTTRPPRDGETDGVDYHFVSTDEFEAHIENDDLIEYEEVYPGRYYGTPRAEVEEKARERPILLDIDVKGAENVKRLFGDEVLVIFIAPPSIDALAQRLRGRGTESDDDLQARLDRAQMEIDRAGRFDALVVNDDLETAVEETLGHVRRFCN